jgi:CheY-like chemotaxis protein
MVREGRQPVRVNILSGRVTIQVGDEEPDVLPDLLAEVTVALVLAPELRVHEQDLLRRFWRTAENRSGMHQAIRRLRDHRLPIPFQKEHDGYYVVDLEPDAVDALRFQRAVAELPATASLEELDALLAMWSPPDPRRLQRRSRREHRGADEWEEVFQARDALVARVAAIPATERRRLPHLHRFRLMFDGDPALQCLRTLVPELNGQPRYRVLIVDDQVGDSFAAMLSPNEYGCEVVKSYEDWLRLRNQGSLNFDCALVDLHLESEMVDKKGLKVLQHLRDHTDIPLTLMTAALDKGDFFKVAQNYVREFQLVTVLNKDNRTDAEAPDLEATVARMVRSRRHGRS